VAANERLQELDRPKTDFVSNVAQELRAPISNILLYLDLARRMESEVKRSHYFNALGSESVRPGGWGDRRGADAVAAGTRRGADGS